MAEQSLHPEVSDLILNDELIQKKGRKFDDDLLGILWVDVRVCSLIYSSVFPLHH